MRVDVSRETSALLEIYVDMLLAENDRQNLIAKASEANVWERHVEDSAQLVRFAPEARNWADIGSGPGLPGLVIAILTRRPVTLVEPRPLRTAFLAQVVDRLALDKVTIVTGKADKASGRFDAITARAVAPLDRLFAMTRHLSHAGTRYVLPKGRSAHSELEAARGAWQGRFRVEPSLTDPAAGIIVAEGVSARGKR